MALRLEERKKSASVQLGFVVGLWTLYIFCVTVSFASD